MRLIALLRHAGYLLLVLALGLRGAAAEQVASEGQLKAAYLVNFLKYVDWPPNQPYVTLCVFGRSNLMTYLAAYEGRQIGGREMRLRRVHRPEQFGHCQELFVPEAEEARFAAIVLWTDRMPVLTVSDAEHFARDGGAISLIRADGRLQFDINTDTLARSGLKPTSQLMRLARQVFGAGR